MSRHTRLRLRPGQNQRALSTRLRSGWPAAKRRHCRAAPRTGARRDRGRARRCAASSARPGIVHSGCVGRQRLLLVDVERRRRRSRRPRSAATRSSSRVVMPRPILMKKALRFIRWNRARFMKPSVSGVCGTVRITKSARGKQRRRARRRGAVRRPRRRVGAALVDADHRHAERGGEPRRLGADAADPDDQRRRLGQVHDDRRPRAAPASIRGAAAAACRRAARARRPARSS